MKFGKDLVTIMDTDWKLFMEKYSYNIHCFIDVTVLDLLYLEFL